MIGGRKTILAHTKKPFSLYTTISSLSPSPGIIPRSITAVFGEVGAFLNLAGTGSADSVEVVSDGSCGEPAQVRVRGRYVLSDYINLGTGIDIVLPGALDGVDLDGGRCCRHGQTTVPQDNALKTNTLLTYGLHPWTHSTGHLTLVPARQTS